MSDLDKPFAEILEKEADNKTTLESDKKKADNAKAVEMQNRAIESMHLTQKGRWAMRMRM